MSRDTITVAAIQSIPRGYLTNPENPAHATELLKKAADLGAEIACFCEGFPAVGEEEIGKSARDLGIFIIGGFLPQENSKVYSECVLFDSGGKVVGRQRKLHVPPGVEPYAHGKNYQTMETPWGKIGILICIDGWGFPEGFRYMSEAGVELIFNPNLIFKKRIQKRISLLSRILDYRIPIVAPNNAVWSFRVYSHDVGMPPEGGQSNIFVPPVYESPKEIERFLREASSCEGWIVAEAGKDEEILLAKIDLSSLRRSRTLWNDAFGGFI